MHRRMDTTIWPSVFRVAADAVQGAYDEDPQEWCESTKSVTAMLRLIDTFGPNQSGKFYDYDGREYQW
jgi:hypothetical protein